MKTERSEIYALAKLETNKYHLRKLYLPREEIQEIRSRMISMWIRRA